MWRHGAFLLCFSLLMACHSAEPSKKIDWQGHRGARGVYPENSLPAFDYALRSGVTTLEMDVVITADNQVVVSHEPYINPSICRGASGDTLKVGSEEDLNIFRMDYEEVRSFDCGSVGNVKFPEQKKMLTAKPLLREVFDLATRFHDSAGGEKPYFNIEIKSRPEWDGRYHPEPGRFAELLMAEVDQAGLNTQVTIQSFDPRPLRYLHQQGRGIRLAILVEEATSAESILDSLGFIPEIYSPYYQLVDPQLISFCHDKEMLVIPWTVNDVALARKLIEWGADGIITDFPQMRDAVDL